MGIKVSNLLLTKLITILTSEIWYQAVFWRKLGLIWVIQNFFIKQYITAIENIRFEIYLRFIWIQTYRSFYFSWKLFAKLHVLSSWCRIFCSRSRSRKIRLLSSSLFLFIVAIVISILLKTIFDKFQSKISQWWKFHSDRTTSISMYARPVLTKVIVF